MVSGTYEVKVPKVVFPGVFFFFLVSEEMGYFNWSPNKALDFNESSLLGRKKIKPYSHSEGGVWYCLLLEMKLKLLLALGK